ncbi:STM3941 family protein [Chryseobacterium sp. SIMBA_038]|uniref:STM3941 family protein n=1 Tax=Chryseobacterium sp. SIMBA_038 TaxID=3085780 RepID=UPI00397CB9F1
MKDLHFYSNKTSNLFLFIVSFLFCVAFVYFYEDLQRKSLFKIIISHFAFILCLFGSAYSFLLLIRRKPLLTISNTHIIIYNLLRKDISVNFEDISKFTVSITTNYRGIKTTEQINIILKSNTKNNNLSSEFPILHEIIQTDILNIKTNDLLKILNDKLKNV